MASPNSTTQAKNQQMEKRQRQLEKAVDEWERRWMSSSRRLSAGRRSVATRPKRHTDSRRRWTRSSLRSSEYVSLETWDDGARRLILALKTSRRRLGGQPAVGASLRPLKVTQPHQPLRTPRSSRCGLQVYRCVCVVSESLGQRGANRCVRAAAIYRTRHQPGNLLCC